MLGGRHYRAGPLVDAISPVVAIGRLIRLRLTSWPAQRRCITPWREPHQGISKNRTSIARMSVKFSAAAPGPLVVERGVADRHQLASQSVGARDRLRPARLRWTLIDRMLSPKIFLDSQTVNTRSASIATLALNSAAYRFCLAFIGPVRHRRTKLNKQSEIWGPPRGTWPNAPARTADPPKWWHLVVDISWADQ
jgi:hypothetical protein